MGKQSGSALYDTAMIICKGGAKMVRGVQNRSGGALYDTAMIICKGGAKTVRGGWVKKRQGGCIIQWNLTNKTTSRSTSNGLICEVVLVLRAFSYIVQYIDAI